MSVTIQFSSGSSGLPRGSWARHTRLVAQYDTVAPDEELHGTSPTKPCSAKHRDAQRSEWDTLCSLLNSPDRLRSAAQGDAIQLVYEHNTVIVEMYSASERLRMAAPRLLFTGHSCVWV